MRDILGQAEEASSFEYVLEIRLAHNASARLQREVFIEKIRTVWLME